MVWKIAMEPISRKYRNNAPISILCCCFLLCAAEIADWYDKTVMKILRLVENMTGFLRVGSACDTIDILLTDAARHCFLVRSCRNIVLRVRNAW